MIFEYEKPLVEVVRFVALQSMATDVRSTREGEGNEGITIPGSMPEMSEGVEDWG